MRPAWKMLREWKLRETVELRSPASVQLLRAVMSVGLAWNWTAFAICMWLGLSCLLRPEEICALRRRDVRMLDEGWTLMSLEWRW